MLGSVRDESKNLVFCNKECQLSYVREEIRSSTIASFESRRKLQEELDRWQEEEADRLRRVAEEEEDRVRRAAKEAEDALLESMRLINAEIDKRVESIHLREGAASKAVGLAFLQLAEDYHPEQFGEVPPATRAAAAVDELRARIDYFLHEAQRELEAHATIEPNDVAGWESLSRVYRLQGRKGDAVRAAEEARKRKLLGEKSRPSAPPATEKDSTGLSFENQALELIRALGFEARTTSRTADGGIDILAESRMPFISGRYVIQCKDWSKPVGEPALRDLLGTVEKNNAVKGILISRHGFTKSARDFAQGTSLELIDGENIDGLIREARRQQSNDPAEGTATAG